MSDFAEAVAEAEDVAVLAEIMQAISDEGERAALFAAHKEAGRLAPKWSAAGERLRPIEWFNLRGLHPARYVAFLARRRLRWAIRIRLKALASACELDDPPEGFDREIGEMVRTLYRMRRQLPEDPP